MKYIKQFVVILLISFMGEILNRLIPLPIPASIYGIVIMFLCLQFGIIKISDVKETGAFLVEIMPVMFIPAAVGLIDSWEILRPSWIAYVSITVITTVIVMAAAGLVTQTIMRKKSKENKRHD